MQVRQLLLSILLLTFSFYPLSAAITKSSEPPLTTEELQEIVPGHTFMGKCHDTQRQFALYFAPDGKVYIQKAGSPFTFYGKWTITNGMLNTPWPYEDLQVHKQNVWAFYQRRDLRTYHLEFREVSPNHYQPYRIRSCSCDPSPEYAFPTCENVSGHVPLQ